MDSLVGRYCTLRRFSATDVGPLFDTSAAEELWTYLPFGPFAEHGFIEVGAVLFAPALQRTAAATEAMFLMAEHAFELGYRRYEWKCNDLNEASHRAAIRLGFTFEGVFRSDLVVKGRSRDTAWFSMLAREWPRHRAAFKQWLHPDNFNSDGLQHRSLSALRGT